MIRQTHTFVTLEVSKSAYLEIRKKLAAADYDHAFILTDEGTAIDMHGIALVSKQYESDEAAERDRNVRKDMRRSGLEALNADIRAFKELDQHISAMEFRWLAKALALALLLWWGVSFCVAGFRQDELTHFQIIKHPIDQLLFRKIKP